MHDLKLIRLATFSCSGFDRGAMRWKEATWWIVRSVFFACWMPVPSSLKVSLLRAYGAKVGDRVIIRSRVNVTFPWRLEIGNDVWIGDEVCILTLSPVIIGSNVCISQRAFLCTGSHNFRVESFGLITEPITVGDSTWIAAQCFIGPGVSIGAGSLCAAGAVIVKDVPDRVLVGGNPARIVKRIGVE